MIPITLSRKNLTTGVIEEIKLSKQKSTINFSSASTLNISNRLLIDGNLVDTANSVIDFSGLTFAGLNITLSQDSVKGDVVSGGMITSGDVLFFKNINKVIDEDFNLSNYEYILQKYPIIDRTISLHIRRDDYVTSNGYHPVQPLSYYEKALDIIGDWNKLLVFSDDIEWCKSNLNFDKIQFVEEANEFETLYLMSHVQDNIIANSSFSWWGAWLNKNPQKRVIAPKLWFGEISGICTDYIVPNTWIKI